MRTVSLRELHARTGEWVRLAADLGEIVVTDRGREIAKIVAMPEVPEVPYFARREASPEFLELEKRLVNRGTDITDLISEDRDER